MAMISAITFYPSIMGLVDSYSGLGDSSKDSAPLKPYWKLKKKMKKNLDFEGFDWNLIFKGFLINVNFKLLFLIQLNMMQAVI